MRVLQKLANWQKTYTYDSGKPLPWWHDNFAHFAGGAVFGVLTHLLLGFGYVGVGVSFLGIAGVWEVYEYTYGIRPWDEEDGWKTDHIVEDTLLDCYVGLTGALLLVWLL